MVHDRNWSSCSCAAACESIVSLLVVSLGRGREDMQYRRPGAAMRGYRQSFLNIQTVFEEERSAKCFCIGILAVRDDAAMLDCVDQLRDLKWQGGVDWTTATGARPQHQPRSTLELNNKTRKSFSTRACPLSDQIDGWQTENDPYNAVRW
jgi:hypothetical protein